MSSARSLQIQEQSQVGEARRLVTHFCEGLGFSEADCGKVAIIVSEAASNLVKHTGGRGGELLCQKIASPAKGVGVEILVLDRGPGMRNAHVSLRDGHSTAGTQGIGLGGIQRLSSEFDLYSLPDLGTALMSRVWKENRDTAPLYPHAPVHAQGAELEVGGISVAIAGETVCGDGWAFSHQQSLGITTLLVADGLGHGPAAHEAAQEAIQVFERKSELLPSEILRLAHGELRKTRGAAVAVIRLDSRAHRATFAGVGNIAGAILSSAKSSQSMVSMNGIVGHECRKIQEFAYPFASGSLVVLHSDGLGTKWDLQRYPGIQNKHPSLIAGVLYRDFKRGRDDCTVVVVKAGASMAGDRGSWIG